MKICSLLPSATEIVYSLGLGDCLAGVTHECDYPPQAASLPVVTSSNVVDSAASSAEIHRQVSQSRFSGISIYQLDEEALVKADPGLILTQQLCDVCAVSYGDVKEAVRRLPGDRPILSLEPHNVEGIMETIRRVSESAGVPERGQAFCQGLQERIEKTRERAQEASREPQRVLALEWLDPPFYGGHWVPEMIAWAGGRDGLGRPGRPSSQVTWDEVAAYDPQVIVLMPCGFEVERTCQEFEALSLPRQWEGLSAVQDGQVYAVNASAYFSRPGPRVVDGLELLAEILHPQLFPRRSPPDAWRSLSPSLIKN
ncbi:MAG TPA: cobalamin-binding protein [Acidobacteriota bacterium]|nr:cobalamin-binding protein [Acidobacteriota bacterium]